MVFFSKARKGHSSRPGFAIVHPDARICTFGDKDSVITSDQTMDVSLTGTTDDREDADVVRRASGNDREGMAHGLGQRATSRTTSPQKQAPTYRRPLRQTSLVKSARASRTSGTPATRNNGVAKTTATKSGESRAATRQSDTRAGRFGRARQREDTGTAKSASPKKRFKQQQKTKAKRGLGTRGRSTTRKGRWMSTVAAADKRQQKSVPPAPRRTRNKSPALRTSSAFRRNRQACQPSKDRDASSPSDSMVAVPGQPEAREPLGCANESVSGSWLSLAALKAVFVACTAPVPSQTS